MSNNEAVVICVPLEKCDPFLTHKICECSKCGIKVGVSKATYNLASPHSPTYICVNCWVPPEYDHQLVTSFEQFLECLDFDLTEHNKRKEDA